MRIGWRAVGHRFRVARIALGMTEEETADACGISLRTYRRYESGGKQRSINPISRFTEKYDVYIDWLLLGEGEGEGVEKARSPFCQSQDRGGEGRVKGLV
jgi:transcriptional regulator with XRE-family HTH domain